MLTAGAVINYARDYHPALNATNAPQRIAYRALSRFMTELRQAIVVRVPAWMAEVVNVPLTADVFENGINLDTLIPQGWTDLVDFRFLYDQSNPQSFVTALFVPYEQRDMRHPIPAVTLLNNVIYLLGSDQVGQLAQAYQNYSNVVLSYTAQPVQITSDNDILTGFPDDAREAFAAMLASFWLRRLVDDPQYAVQRSTADYFDGVAGSERANFLTRIFRTTQRQSYYIRDMAP